MRVLVTGATGKVGHATALALLAAGYDVRALVYDREPAAAVLPNGVEAIRGDVTEPSGLAAATAGCEMVFIAHGLPQQWLADPAAFERVNVAGAAAVVRAAIAAGTRRVVHTSTVNVFAKDSEGRLRETSVDPRPKRTHYERSKQQAERAVIAAAGGRVEIVMVNPAAVYGPGPPGSASLETGLFEPIVRRQRMRLPFLPPGAVGLVYAESVGRGQVLAAENGTPGERYILCDAYLTLRELAEAVVRIAGRGRIPPVLPTALAWAMAMGGEALARVTRRPPLLPAGQLTFFLWRARPDSSKAQEHLVWAPTPLDVGLRRTIAELRL